MLSAKKVANTRLRLKTLSIMFLVVVSFVLVDVVISSLVDIYRDLSTSQVGMSLFVSIMVVLVAGTHVILKSTGDKIREHSKKGTYESKLATGVWSIYFLMVAIMIFVVLQIILFSEYYTALLSLAPTVSYGLAAYIMGVLGYRFFSWFITNRDLGVLLYGFASVSASIYVGLVAVIFNVEILVHQPTVMTVDSAASFPAIEPGFEQILIITLPGILIASTFLSFWGGTIAILYANIRRIGKTRFWILVTTPIVFFLGTLISLFPVIQGVAPENDPNSIIIPIYVTTFSQVTAIGLFAIAFVSMARAIPHHLVSDYMYITCFGLTLFSIGIIATVSGAGYPPFGLPTVSLVGPFSFLLFTGLNHSAISTAEDSLLRRSIKVSARQQLKLLHSIGTAEMEDRLQKKVLEITKSNAENLTKQSGIEPSLSLSEAKQYLHQVIGEAKDRKKGSSNGNPETRQLG